MPFWAVCNKAARVYYGLFQGKDVDDAILEFAEFKHKDIGEVIRLYERGLLTVKLAEEDSGIEYWPQEAREAFWKSKAGK